MSGCRLCSKLCNCSRRAIPCYCWSNETIFPPLAILSGIAAISSGQKSGLCNAHNNRVNWPMSPAQSMRDDNNCGEDGHCCFFCARLIAAVVVSQPLELGSWGARPLIQPLTLGVPLMRGYPDRSESEMRTICSGDYCAAKA